MEIRELQQSEMTEAAKLLSRGMNDIIVLLCNAM